ncbi:MAG: hypothetical protein DRI71_07780 [Bacteroidetes bacterium]|nr:MAG: hypothetical protein DRI71_07780 [Bacteroidota bacterium]
MKTGTFVAMIFLILVTITHILRIFMQVKVTVGAYDVPMWMSYAAVILTIVLAASIWNEHRNNHS